MVLMYLGQKLKCPEHTKFWHLLKQIAKRHLKNMKYKKKSNGFFSVLNMYVPFKIWADDASIRY